VLFSRLLAPAAAETSEFVTMKNTVFAILAFWFVAVCLIFVYTVLIGDI
jgi:hypothetical protein